MVGPGLLKKLCPFVSVEGDPLNPLQCRPWQISPAFIPQISNVFFKTRWGCQPHTPNPQRSWRTDVFLLGLSPLADQPWFKCQGLALLPYVSLPSKTLPRGHDVDMHVWDLVGMYGISWVLLVHSCQQAMHPQGHILPLWPPQLLFTIPFFLFYAPHTHTHTHI